MQPGPGTATERVRQFNRSYTRRLGLLHEHLLKTPFSLTEARVLYEIAHRTDATATGIREALGLDAGYLSRLLGRFQGRGLITRVRAAHDGRQALLGLSARGRRETSRLESASRGQVEAMLSALTASERTRLVGAMGLIQELLERKDPGRQPSFVVRAPRPGDMGWVVQRHGAVYAQEYGWDAQFEALVGDIVARFARTQDPARERSWIAEGQGENLGCIFCVHKSKTVAQLRLLLVEPQARGLGIGRRLVAECIAFARHAGYRRMVLWTNDVLHAARHLYEDAGFVLVKEERHRSFGHALVGQTWSLDL